MSETVDFTETMERVKMIAARVKSGEEIPKGLKRQLDEDGGEEAGSAPKRTTAEGHQEERDSSSTALDIVRPGQTLIGDRQVEEHSVPNSMVGLIIGRSGEQISQIQMESNCRVQMTAPVPGALERVCTLTGTPSAIDKCRRLIDAIVASRPEEDFARRSAGGGRRGGNDDAAAGGFSIELKIPARKGGLIIGKGGETISGLQRAAGVRMHVLQDEEGADQRTVTIQGPQAGCEQARQMVLDLISRDSAGGAGLGPGKQEVVYVIPSRHCGAIIGKRGETIRNITQQSGARVDISKDPAPSDPSGKTLTIRGTPEQLEQVRQLVYEIIGDLPEPLSSTQPQGYGSQPQGYGSQPQGYGSQLQSQPQWGSQQAQVPQWNFPQGHYQDPAGQFYNPRQNDQPSSPQHYQPKQEQMAYPQFQHQQFRQEQQQPFRQEQQQPFRQEQQQPFRQEQQQQQYGGPQQYQPNSPGQSFHPGHPKQMASSAQQQASIQYPHLLQQQQAASSPYQPSSPGQQYQPNYQAAYQTQEVQKTGGEQQQQQQQQQAVQQSAGGQVDYTDAWIKYYRANGNTAEAEKLERQRAAKP